MAIPFKKYDSEDEKLKNTLVSTEEGTAVTPLYTPGENVPGATAGTPITDNGREQYYAGANAEIDESKEKNYPRYDETEVDEEAPEEGVGGSNEYSPLQSNVPVEKSYIPDYWSKQPSTPAFKGIGVAADSMPKKSLVDNSVKTPEEAPKLGAPKVFAETIRTEAPKTYQDLYNQYMQSPVTAEEEAKRKRAASQISGIKALGNVANAFSNLVFTGQGAPSQTLPQLADPGLQAYSDRLRAQRDAFANAQIRARQLDEAHESDLWNREYKKAAQKQQAEHNAALLKWKQDDAEANRAAKKEVAEANNAARLEAAKIQAEARKRAAAISGSHKSGGSSSGSNSITLTLSSGATKDFSKKEHGETYLNKAIEALKRSNPNMVSQMIEKKLGESDMMGRKKTSLSRGDMLDIIETISAYNEEHPGVSGKPMKKVTTTRVVKVPKSQFETVVSKTGEVTTKAKESGKNYRQATDKEKADYAAGKKTPAPAQKPTGIRSKYKPVKTSAKPQSKAPEKKENQKRNASVDKLKKLNL